MNDSILPPFILTLNGIYLDPGTDDRFAMEVWQQVLSGIRISAQTSTPPNPSCAPVLVILEPDDAHPASKGAYYEINGWHGTKPEDLPEKRDVEDKDQATYRSGKHPSHRLVGSA
jgi:hypothetical protein